MQPNGMLRFFCVSFFCSMLCGFHANLSAIEVRVLELLPETKSVRVEVTASEMDAFEVGSVQTFRFGAGDLEIGYVGRLIKADANFWGNAWHLEQVFPLDGVGAKAMRDVNRQLRDLTASMSRRDYLKEGDYVPNFALIDEEGNFLQVRQLKGKPFILNFIFTRCTVAKMCPASSFRMAELQEVSRDAGLNSLHFMTISFDPEFDSPGILNQYAKGFGIETENFHLLTGSKTVVDDLLRQFGILTMEEDGTINHTMATFLIDANGRIAFRKEGSSWTVEEFMREAKAL